MNIYVPDDLAEQVKQVGDLNISAVCQKALRDEVNRISHLPKLPAKPVQLTIELDHADFEQLRVNGMQWHGLGWHDMPGRFIATQGGDIDWSYRQAYWFTDAASVILARSYLHGSGEPHQVLWDEADDGHSPYVIITNYNG